MVIALGVVFTSCKDRNAEKKIAELESRLAELEGKKTVSPSAAAPTPATQPVKEEKPEGPLPQFQFETVDHDFGTIKEGQVVEYTLQVQEHRCSSPDHSGCSGFVWMYSVRLDQNADPGWRKWVCEGKIR